MHIKMQKFLEKHHIYYGWVMVVAGILVMSVTHGVVQNCFSQFIKPVSESLNVSRSSFAINMTILNVVYMIVALFSGKIFVKLKLRNLMRIASVALPIIYFSYSFCREMWMFYALSVAAGLMMSCLTFLAFTMIISQWFIEKRGTAIGVCFMGSGLGGMLFQRRHAVGIERAVGAGQALERGGHHGGGDDPAGVFCDSSAPAGHGLAALWLTDRGSGR